MAEKKRINAHVPIDEKRLFDAVVEESDAESQREWIMRHAREDAEEFGIDGEADIDAILDDGGESSIDETYDPDEFDGTLDSEQLREIVTNDPDAEINPEHVGSGKAATPQGYRTDIVEAMTRYAYTSVSRDDVVELCKDIGLDTRYFIGERKNDKDIPGQVVDRFGGDDDGATVDDDVVAKQAAGATLIVDGEATVRDYSALVSTWETAREDADLSYDAQEVVAAALDKLSGVSAVPSHRVSETVDEWPETAGGLVDWYVDENEGDLGGDTRGHVAAEIAEHIRDDAPLPIIETDGTHVTAGAWAANAEQMASNDDLPVSVLEQHLERAEAALEERPEHPAADRLREAVEEFREEVEERRAEEAEA